MHFSLSRFAGTAAAIACAAVLTGPMQPERNAFVLAEKEINDRGGVNGRPMKFLIENDEGKADTAAQLATRLLGQNVALIIGGSLTPTSAAIARVTNDVLNQTRTKWLR